MMTNNADQNFESRGFAERRSCTFDVATSFVKPRVRSGTAQCGLLLTREPQEGCGFREKGMRGGQVSPAVAGTVTTDPDPSVVEVRSAV